MSITRTPWIDDDGTGTTGTVINNSEKQALYSQIDASCAFVNQQNVFQAAQIVRVNGPVQLLLNDTSAPVDNRTFDLLLNGGTLNFRVLNDAMSGLLATPLQLDHYGNAYVQGWLFERGRSSAMGEWVVGDVNSFCHLPGFTGPHMYALVGRSLLLVMSGTGATSGEGFIRINLPGGFALPASLTSYSPPITTSSLIGSNRHGVAYGMASAGYIDLYQQEGAVWPTGTASFSCSLIIPIA